MEKRNPVNQDQEAENGAHVSGVGALLRASRLRSGLDLQEIARALRIRRLYLQAIEDGRFEELPGATYATGFIRTYANYLGLDADEVVRRFRDESGPVARPSLVMPTPLKERSNPSAALLLIGLLIAVFAYGGWYVAFSSDDDPVATVQDLPKRILKLLSNERAGESQPTDEIAAKTDPGDVPAEELQTSTAEMTSSSGDVRAADQSAPEGLSGTPFAPPDEGRLPAQLEEVMTQSQQALPIDAAPGQDQVVNEPPLQTSARDQGLIPAAEEQVSRIVLKAILDSWIQIETQEGGIIASRLLRAGDAFNVPDRDGLLLVTGNAGGLSIVVDGADIPALGPVGAVRRNVALDAERLQAGTAID